MGTKGDQLSNAASVAAEGLQDSLTPLGDIRLKKMFGGYGVFEEEAMFALVDSKGVIHFKVDETNLAQYQAANAEKHARMPYYQVPASVLEDEGALQEWAKLSIAIAKQAKK